MAHDQHPHHDHAEGVVDWDEVYAEAGDRPMWSGRPNGALLADVIDLPVGSALDVGCGEGADAIWLARRGWQVTALDPSQVALERARSAAARWDVVVSWVHAGLLDLPAGVGPHDLVSAQYPALLHSDDDAAIHALLGAVAPGGTLLVVHHLVDHDHDGRDEHGHDDDRTFDPADYVMPDDVAARLDDDWVVELHGIRPRPGPLPDAARHVQDVVLRARRHRRVAGT